MSLVRRAFALTADGSGNDLAQANVGIVEVIAVEWDAGTAGEATLAVSTGDAPFLSIDVPGVYRPSDVFDDELGVETGTRCPVFTPSGQLLFGLSGATPEGVGTVTVTYRR